MDRKDYQIVRALMRDGRLTNQDLAARVNLSPSPCLRRLRLLEERGVITGYAAVVDQKSMGYPITVFVGIRLSRHDRETVERFERSIDEIDEILDCFLMTGAIDYQLRVVAPDLDGYERFVRDRLHAIDGIASIDTSLAFGIVKQSRILPMPG
ncbi:Lrp/AsnC family transcriptional regulator [Sphingopyxis sp.]|jgi:Lrp/AsnC family leucine-responsive transcriptional regulator|uniref:Lrp/AsnC family transcriptional regulator n=1 Tax=Sphingopyxis sp. TaxID=1908224 RepID=UPI003F7018A4